MRMISRFCLLTCAALLCFAATGASASTFSGQSYATFAEFYQEDISFINKNDSRHLLPLVIAKRNSDLEDGRLIYELMGDTLSLSIMTDPSGEIIESCIISLTAPPDMEYGNAAYNDFAISGYHSYALLMAMHTDPSAAERYQLVTDVVNGMAEGGGRYMRQLGVYTLSCVREGSTATLSFVNNRAQTAPEDEPIDEALESETSTASPGDTPEGEGEEDAGDENGEEEDVSGLL